SVTVNSWSLPSAVAMVTVPLSASIFLSFPFWGLCCAGRPATASVITTRAQADMRNMCGSPSSAGGPDDTGNEKDCRTLHDGKQAPAMGCGFVACTTTRLLGNLSGGLPLHETLQRSSAADEKGVRQGPEAQCSLPPDPASGRKA